MDERGRIRNPLLATQLRDFTGLRYGKITPTDIDAFIDFGDKLFVFIEAKITSTPLPYGQRLALQRLVDAAVSDTRASVGIVCEHANREGEIDFAHCRVTEYRWKGKWIAPRQFTDVRQAVDAILKQLKLYDSMVRA